MKRWLLVALLAGCASVDTVRIQAETVDVGPNARPIAGVQAAVASFYILGIAIPGDRTLDRVVNRMLIAATKSMGADKIYNLTFEVECPAMCLAKIFGVLEARASGIAVQMTAPPPDPAADDGPEPPPTR